MKLQIAKEIAKEALKSQNVEIKLKFEYKELFQNMDNIVKAKWQAHYENTKTGKFYKNIEPTVSSKIKYKNSYRKIEVAVTRLRLGFCTLNSYMHQNKNRWTMRTL